MIEITMALLCSLLFFAGATYPAAPVFAVLFSCLITVTMAVVYSRLGELAKAAVVLQGSKLAPASETIDIAVAQFLDTHKGIDIYIETPTGLVPIANFYVARLGGRSSLILEGVANASGQQEETPFA